VPGAWDTAIFNGSGNGNTTITVPKTGQSIENITFDTANAAEYQIKPSQQGDPYGTAGRGGTAGNAAAKTRKT